MDRLTKSSKLLIAAVLLCAGAAFWNWRSAEETMSRHWLGNFYLRLTLLAYLDDKFTEVNADRLVIMPLNGAADAAAQQLKVELEKRFIKPVEIRPEVFDLAASYDPARGRHRADWLLPALAKSFHRDGEFVLVLTAVDLCSEYLNFTFSSSDAAAGVAVISLARMNLYNPSTDLLGSRLFKISARAIGSMLGFGRSLEPRCVMSFKATVKELDQSGAEYCSAGQLARLVELGFIASADRQESERSQ